MLEEETQYKQTNNDILGPGEIRGDLANRTITLVFITLNGIYKRP